MATDVAAAGGASERRADEDREDRDRRPSQSPEPRPDRAAGHGFFAIYKKGQGYWTRMGTAMGVALLGGLTAYNLYVWMPVLMNLGSSPDALNRERQIAAGVAAVFFALFAVLAWRAMNKPSNVDFLIATDSEMKKVNWTSRRELIGSTKVVIVFMFLIAFFLFGIDIVFSYFFYLIDVLKSSPFGSGGAGTIGGG